jgi:hypothetical protein
VDKVVRREMVEVLTQGTLVSLDHLADDDAGT